MCLAVPGQIEEILMEGELTRLGRVNFAGIRKEINLCCVPEAQVGDYVIVHVGMAINVLDQDEAEKTLQYMTDLGILEEEIG